MSQDFEQSGSHPGRVLVIDLEDNSLQVGNVMKGLASDPRIAILRYLGGSSCSVNEIAKALGMPPSTATMHVNILEEAGLVHTELKPATRGLQKICARTYDRVVVVLPRGELPADNVIDISMPIGMYVDCQVEPTCGLASETGIIGQFDDFNTFYDPGRVNAQLLWFKQGYVEYRFPNRLPPQSTLKSLQISLEICSEAPLHSDEWLSDITLWINAVEIGTWTSPGDFGGTRGALTPSWWEEWNSQYGLLKMWKVNQVGSFVDGNMVSNVTLSDLRIGHSGYISVRIGVKPDAANVGGLNIFGRAFGNYPQDIVMRMVYEP